jgi:hypothetical protein
MNEMDFEAQVRAIAARMQYPRTPDIAGSIRARLHSPKQPRLLSKAAVWSLTILLVLITSLMLIPPARAAIIEFIQIGVVRIFRAEPTPVGLPNQTLPEIPVTATPSATQQPLIPLLQDLVGETTLEKAQKRVKYPLLLPSYPSDLGKPDYVFVQDADGAMAILVWLDPQNPDQVLMSLHFIPAGSWAIKKMELTDIEPTSVDGQRAIWTTGPYPIKLQNGDVQYMRMISGHVLIWENENVTYRLETDLKLDEAVKIAESLRPIPSP